MADGQRATRKLTKARKERFLAALRNTGQPTHAAAAASPHAEGAAYSTFAQERKRNPEFAAAWEAAEAEGLDLLQDKVVSRAMDGVVVEERVIHDEKAGKTTEITRRAFDFRREQAVLARARPEWRTSAQVDLNADVKARASVATVPFDVRQFEGLSKDGRNALRVVLAELKEIQERLNEAASLGIEIPKKPNRDFLRSELSSLIAQKRTAAIPAEAAKGVTPRMRRNPGEGTRLR